MRTKRGVDQINDASVQQENCLTKQTAVLVNIPSARAATGGHRKWTLHCSRMKTEVVLCRWKMIILRRFVGC